jgi:uncharacterized phage-associated protein
MSHHHATITGEGGYAGLFAVSLGAIANWILTWFQGFELTTTLAVLSTLITFYCAVPQVFKTTTFLKEKAKAWKGKPKS